jgi:bifunctional non-homologous end joining protein LigD
LGRFLRAEEAYRDSRFVRSKRTISHSSCSDPYLDGRDLLRLPQRERRRLLEPIVAGREGAVRLSEEVQADGEEFLRVACAHGLEGTIARHRQKPYRSGRNDWWRKITSKRRDSFAIVG